MKNNALKETSKLTIKSKTKQQQTNLQTPRQFCKLLGFPLKLFKEERGGAGSVESNGFTDVLGMSVAGNGTSCLCKGKYYMSV